MSEVADVVVERQGHVQLISINRSAKKNAMTAQGAELLAGAIDELDASDDLRVGVLTGRGGNFCAGMDLARFAQGERPVVPGRGFGGLVERPPNKPLVGAVEGWALGGGFELVLACDLVVAARGARFGLPEVTRGLVARGGGMLRLPRYLPRPLAMEVLLTGDVIEASRAHSWGLVNFLVPDGEALDMAMEVAERIAANAPLSLICSKQVATAAREWTDEEMWSKQSAWTDPVFASEDAREGPLAFLEQRDPNWKGH